MKKRMGKDIWKGLYEFYLVESTRPDNNATKAGQTIKQLIKAGKAVKKPVIYKSVLSHQVIKANFLHLYLNKKDILKKVLDEPGTGLFTRKEAELLPKPVLIDNYLKEVIF
jgi:A/G-specific adenine glycosylase